VPLDKAIFDDPEFKALPFEKQQDVRVRYLEGVRADPDFVALQKSDPKAAGEAYARISAYALPMEPTHTNEGTPVERARLQAPGEDENIVTQLFDPGVLLDPANIAAGAGAGAKISGTVGGAVKGAVQAAAGGYGVAGQLAYGIGKGLAKKPDLVIKGQHYDPTKLEDPGLDRLAQTRGKSLIKKPDVPPQASVPSVQAPAEQTIDDLFSQNLTPQRMQSVTQLGKDYFKHFPELIDDKVSVTDNLVREYMQGKITPEWMQTYGLTHGDLVSYIKQSSRESAQRLAYLSHVFRNVDPAIGEKMRELGGGLPEQLKGQGVWRRATNIWRASLVSQMATAARNFISQTGRLTMNVFEDAINSGLQKVTGSQQTVHPLDGLETFVDVFRKMPREQARAILDKYPKIQDRLHMSYSSDVDKMTGVGNKVLGALETGVEALNWANRFQEYLIRDGVFRSVVHHELRNAGYDLATIIKTNNWESVPGKVMQAAFEKGIGKALDMTFAGNFKQGTVAKKILDVANLPGMAPFVPFPRFMMNALKFMYQYSPVGWMDPTAMKQFAAGNYERGAKAMVGTGMMLAGYMARKSQPEHTKWYEWEMDDGRIIDTRPFNPLVSYLFIGEMVKQSLKKQRGETVMNPMTVNDVIQGFASVNVRAGTGHYLLDSVYNILTGEGSQREKAARILKEFTGTTAGGFTTPLKQLVDLAGEFDEAHRTLREQRAEPFAGPTMKNIPGLATQLPEKAVPTQGAPVKTVHPFFVRQLTGLTVSEPKTPVKKELDTLGFKPNDILPMSGDVKADMARARFMGPLMDELGSVVSDPTYKEMEPEQRKWLLGELVSGIREAANSVGEHELSDKEQMERWLNHQPGHTKPFLRKMLKGAGYL